MPNKSIQHTELDKAIKDNLLQLKATTTVNWEEVHQQMASKHQHTSPLTGLPLNLNTMVAVGTAGTLMNIGSLVNLFRKWSGPISYLAGTLVVAVGGYYIFESSNSKRNPKPENKTEQVKDFQPSVKAPAPVSAPVAVPGEPIPLPPASEQSTAAHAAPVPAAPLNITKETVAPEKENNDLSTETSPIVNKRDTSSVFDSKEEDAKSSKILYYKENLTLDRLEQELGKAKKDSVK